MNLIKPMIGMAIFLSIFSDSLFAGELVRIGCKAEFLAQSSFSVFPEAAISLSKIQCLEMDQNQAELKTQPTAIVERFKVPGNELRAIIEENGKQVEKTYLDSQTIITRSHYHIPDCGKVDGKWRLQIAAIADNGKVANEEFYHLIRGISRRCGVVNQEMNNMHFCKTENEHYGHAMMSVGGNTTSRLFIVSDSIQLLEKGIDVRRQLVSYCQQNVQTSLLVKINSCMDDVRKDLSDGLELEIKAQTGLKAMIIPPIDLLNQNFKVENNKYQFSSCESLRTSSALK